MSSLRRLLFTILVTVLLLSVFQAGALAKARYACGLAEVLATVSPDSMIPVFVNFHDPLEPSRIRKEIAGMNLQQRRGHVIERLQENLAEAAGDAINWIRREESRGRADALRPLWICHSYALYLRADRIGVLASHPQVATICYDRLYSIEECIDDVPVEEIEDVPVNSVGWGVEAVGATVLWRQGYTGRGAIIALIDTGVYWRHQDLINRLWTNENEIPDNGIDDDENGYIDDVHGFNIFPDDDNDINDAHGHGTKAAGILVGDGTGGDTTGVAPGAWLMVIRNWDDEGRSSESTHFTAVQYALANGADVISCSMSYDHINNQGEHEFNEFDVYHRTTQVFSLLSGLIQANSQGNNGDGDQPLNVNAPGRCPPPWLHPDQEIIGGTSAMISTGAFRSDGSRFYSSSVGPTEWYEDFYPDYYRDYPYNNGADFGLLKPDVMSPTSARTTSRTGGYSTFTGESCAAPHLGGAIGLLRSIHQQASPANICRALKMTAQDEGEPGHDNYWGAGKLRIDLAHDYLDDLYHYGSLEVTVVDTLDEGIAGARVEVGTGLVVGWTDEEGFVRLDRIIEQTYDIWAYADGFRPNSRENLVISEGETRRITITLQEAQAPVTPGAVNEAMGQDDTLSVVFTIDNPEPEEFNVDIRLRQREELDWEAERHIDFPQLIGSIEAHGVAVVDTIVGIVGNRPDGDPRIWLFDLDGNLLDSLLQPARFPDGMRDLAAAEGGTIFAAEGEMLFTLDSDWSIIDSLQTPVESITGIACDDRFGRFYLSLEDGGMVLIDENGNQLNQYNLGGSSAGIAYNPDDTHGQAIYSFETSGDGMAELVRVDLNNGDTETLADLALDEVDIAAGLDIDTWTGRPYQRIITLQLGSGIRMFNREIQQTAVQVQPFVTISPGGSTTVFRLFGSRTIPGDLLEWEINFARGGGVWDMTVPVNIEIIDYSVAESEETALPKDTELLPPFPNPFNATVQLEYRLFAAQDVNLTVYNVLGQAVAVLDNGRREPGIYRFTWKAKGQATGLYIAVLKTPYDRQAVKLLLVR